MIREREVEGAESDGPLKEEVPYGLQVSDDCLYLEENPAEIEAMRRMLEQVVADRPLSAAAEELNRRGFRQRHGTPGRGRHDAGPRQQDQGDGEAQAHSLRRIQSSMRSSGAGRAPQ